MSANREQERFVAFSEAHRKEIAELKAERNWFAAGFIILFVLWFLTIAAVG